MKLHLSALALALLVVPSGPLVAAQPAASGRPPVKSLADLFGDPVIAKATGIEIKRSQLDEAFVAYRAKAAARGEQIGDTQRTALEARLLDNILSTKLVAARATEADRTKAKELAAKAIADMKKRAPSEDAFLKQLTSSGTTLEELQTRTYEQALPEAVVERELKSKIVVTDAQVRALFDDGVDLIVQTLQEELAQFAVKADSTPEDIAKMKARLDQIRKANLSRLEEPERIRVSHLLLSTRVKDSDQQLPEDERQVKRKEIEVLQKRIRAGEDFKKLVLQFSEDRNLKENNGEYLVAKDDPYVPEFKAAALSLSPGQVSDIVTSVFGFHLIKQLERIPAKKADFEKVRTEIKDFLLEQQLQKQMPEYLAKVKSEASVEILDKRFKMDLPKKSE